MVTAKICRDAAQGFLDELSDRLLHLPPEFDTLKGLAKAAGVSGATPSDYKNKRKLQKPEFRPVFQLAYALLGRSPCSLKEPVYLINHRISKALEMDKESLLEKLAQVLIDSPDSPGLDFVKSAIETAAKKINTSIKSQDSSL
jgi:hypothetical protein